MYAQDPHSMTGKTSSVDTFYISVDTISVSCHQVVQTVLSFYLDDAFHIFGTCVKSMYFTSFFERDPFHILGYLYILAVSSVRWKIPKQKGNY